MSKISSSGSDLFKVPSNQNKPLQNLKKLYKALRCGSHLRNNSLPNYQIGPSLGCGAFASVFLATNSQGQQFALKKINKNLRNYQLIKYREIQVGCRLNHIGIPQLIECYEDEFFGYFVFEYVQGGDLLGFLQTQDFIPLDELEIRHIFSQLVLIVQYIHQQGIYHRDIKLENVLIQPNGSVKLIDFGLSIQSLGKTCFCKDSVGSVEYCSP